MEMQPHSGRPSRSARNRHLKSPSAAAQIAQDGDTIEIEAGVYARDAAVWKQNDLMIRGVGGRAHLRAGGAHADALRV